MTKTDSHTMPSSGSMGNPTDPRAEFQLLWQHKLMPALRQLKVHNEPRTVWLAEHCAWKAFMEGRRIGNQ